MDFLKAIKINAQIMAIGGIAVAGFAIIGVIYFTSAAKLASFSEAQEAASEERQVTDRVQYEFLNARRREKDFLIRLDAKYVKKHGEVVEAIRTGLEELKTLRPRNFRRRSPRSAARWRNPRPSPSRRPTRPTVPMRWCRA